MSGRRCGRAIAWQEDGRWECRTCGRPLSVDDHNRPKEPTRHRGEHSTTVVPDFVDAPAYVRAVELGEQAAKRLPDISSPEEMARAIVEELYRSGLLRQTLVKQTTAA